MIGAAAALRTGCAMGGASILSVGPTNLTVLREGMTRGRVWLVVILFSLVDLALILPAYFAADAVSGLAPVIRNDLSWIAVAVISYFAFRAFRAGFGFKPVPLAGPAERETASVCARRVLPVMLLNPLAYLELFFLPAALFATFNAPLAKLDFMAAMIVVSFIGFCAYGFGGRLISGIIGHRGALPIFDRICGVILSAVAIMLALSLGR